MGYEVEKSDDQWRQELSAEEYAVLRKAGTERAFTGEYTDTETTGIYRCKACQAKLFESETKFHSGCGWPSFYQPITDTVEYVEDSALGMKRVEVRCANCGSHLGHVFDVMDDPIDVAVGAKNGSIHRRPVALLEFSRFRIRLRDIVFLDCHRMGLLRREHGH